MKKLRSILAMFMIVVLSSIFFVACSINNDDKDSTENTQEQIIKEKFDSAYQSFISAGKYAQEFSYIDSSNNTSDGVHKATKVVTNCSGGVTKIYGYDADGEGKDLYYFLNETSAALTIIEYNMDKKQYTSMSIKKEQLDLQDGSASLAIIQLKWNKFFAGDIDFNFFFDTLTKQYASSNAVGEYSTKTELGYEFLIYTITTNTDKYEYTLSMKNNKVISFEEHSVNLIDDSFKTKKTTFRYEGDDLTISVNVSDFTEIEE